MPTRRRTDAAAVPALRPTAAQRPTAARDAPDKQAAVTAGPQAAALQRAREHIAAYAAPQEGRSARVVFVTCAAWLGMLLLGVWLFRRLPLNTWWGLATAAAWVVVRVATFVRCFSVMHDAVHGALFKRRWMNRWTGIVTGFMAGTDAPDMGVTHAQHHAVLGIEEHTNRDPDLTVLWTTHEWAAWPRGLSKAAARVMCDPLVFFTAFVPVLVLAFNVAWPHRVTHQSSKSRVLYIMRRLVLVPSAVAALFFITGTTRTHLLAEVIAGQIALSYAMFQFHVHHVFEGVYRVPAEQHTRADAAFCGSSFLPVPFWWRPVLLGVEYHHIHHFNVRVPGYRMKECHDAAPPGLWDAAGVHQLSARDGFHSLLLSLWDPDQQRYVPFPEWHWLERLLASKPDGRSQTKQQQLQQPAAAAA